MNPDQFTRLSVILQDETASSAADEEQGRVAEQKVRQYMSLQVEWASGLLKQLAAGASAGPVDKLNPAVVNSATALAFVNSRKGGFGLSLASGYGFIIKKLNQDQYGHSTWSNPLFFRVSQTGLGISIGYQQCQSVMALLSMGAVEFFKHGTSSFGSDLGLFSTDGALTGVNGGAALGQVQRLGITVDQDRSTFCYSVVDGAYIELSLHGSSITPDVSSNRLLYGDLSPDDILAGKAGPRAFPELLPLVRTINELGQAAVQGANR